MKRRGLTVVLVSFLFLFPSFAQSQPDRIFEKLFKPKIHPGDLRIIQLEMNPDPVREGQWVSFQAAVSNRSHHSARVRNDGSPFRADIRIQNHDQLVARLNDVILHRGHYEFLFPYTRYQFQGFDHCFTVIADVERTPYRMDAAREFCAKPYGWSLRP